MDMHEHREVSFEEAERVAEVGLLPSSAALSTHRSHGLLRIPRRRPT